MSKVTDFVKEYIKLCKKYNCIINYEDYPSIRMITEDNDGDEINKHLEKIESKLE